MVRSTPPSRGFLQAALLLLIAGSALGSVLARDSAGRGPQRGADAQPPARRQSPPQPQQQQGVEYFVGSWRFTWVGRESSISAGPRTGTISFTRIGDSNFLDVRAEGSSDNGRAYRENGVIGWNADKKMLAYSEHLAGGVDIFGFGDWSSPIAIRWEMAPVLVQGKLLRLKRTYSILSAQSFTATEELSIDGGPFLRLGTGDFRKLEAGDSKK